MESTNVGMPPTIECLATSSQALMSHMDTQSSGEFIVMHQSLESIACFAFFIDPSLYRNLILNKRKTFLFPKLFLY